MKKIYLIILLLITTNSFSEEYESNFKIEKFKVAQNSGKTIIIHSWNKFCGTCSKQKKILKLAKKDFKDLIFLNFEHTKQKDIAKYLNIEYWTTIVVYKGKKQIAKSIGLYKKDNIYLLINKGI